MLADCYHFLLVTHLSVLVHDAEDALREVSHLPHLLALACLLAVGLLVGAALAGTLLRVMHLQAHMADTTSACVRVCVCVCVCVVLRTCLHVHTIEYTLHLLILHYALLFSPPHTHVSLLCLGLPFLFKLMV